MSRYILCLILFFSINQSILNGQQKNTPAVLERLFSRISSNIPDHEKLIANDSIKSIITNYLKSDSVLRHKFTNIKYLGQIISGDSRLKIVSWNLLLKDTASRYYCYFINRRKEGNRIYSLESEYKKEPVNNYILYNSSNWYGALYYDLRPVKKDGKVYWILLGIDYGNPSVTRKIIDVLSFGPDDDCVFGKDWFYDGKTIKFREVLEYSFTAVISLRFLSDKYIVFDHLVPFSRGYENNREFYGPDFSYDAYKYEKGIWHLKSNVDVRNVKNK